MVSNLMNEHLQTNSKQALRIRQLIIHGLVEILELYPQYSIAQHLCYLTDRKLEGKDCYKFTDNEILKEIEKYNEKLEEEVIEGEEVYFEAELN